MTEAKLYKITSPQGYTFGYVENEETAKKIANRLDGTYCEMAIRFFRSEEDAKTYFDTSNEKIRDLEKKIKILEDTLKKTPCVPYPSYLVGNPFEKCPYGTFIKPFTRGDGSIATIRYCSCPECGRNCQELEN